MKYSELARATAEHSKQPLTTTQSVLNAMQEVVKKTLTANEEVVLGDLGRLNPVHREAHKGRNPQTGAEVDVPARRTAKFVCAKALKNLDA